MLTKNAIKIITSLGSKKFRQKYNLFVVEGVKNVKEVLKSPIKIQDLYTTNPNFESEGVANIYHISEAELKKISFLTTPNEVLAVCRIPSFDASMSYEGLKIMLDTVNDPGNLGTIIRLADWFGVSEIICSKETVDLYNPKVIMSTMGSFTRVKLCYTDLSTYLKDYPYPVLGTFMEGESIYAYDFPEDVMILMGNEANGISEGLMTGIDHKIGIPSFGQSTESLNVAMATSIVLGEIFSQKCRK